MLSKIGEKVETFLDNTEEKHGLFLKKLGNRAGLLLKEFAILVLVVGIILSIIIGIATFFDEPAWAKELRTQYGSTPYSYDGVLYSEVRAQYRAAGLTTLVGGIAGSIFTFLLLLGFGQLVEEHTLMRKLTERQMGLPDETKQERPKPSKEDDDEPWHLKPLPKDNK